MPHSTVQANEHMKGNLMRKTTGAFSVLTMLEGTGIAVHENRCVVVRNRNARCLRCVEACTSGCIALAGNELCIAPDNCVGCGACTTACPTSALETHDPSDAELLESALATLEKTNGLVVCACEKALSDIRGVYNPEKLVRITCLGRIEEALLTSLVAAGATDIRLLKAQCDECESRAGLLVAQAVCSTTNVILDTWNRDARVVIVEELPPVARLSDTQSYDDEKREFFTQLFRGAKRAAGMFADPSDESVYDQSDAAGLKYVKVTDDGTLPPFFPERRVRLIESLTAFGTPQDILIETRLWGHVIIDEDTCSSCQMCATFCPTGAIRKFKEADGSFGVDFWVNRCVKCRCCTDICTQHAIKLSEEVFAVDILSETSERISMRPVENPGGNPHAIHSALKSLLGSDQIFER